MQWILFFYLLSEVAASVRGNLYRKLKSYPSSSFQCPPVSSEPGTCPNEPEVVCGYVMRPLDSSGEVPGILPIYYRYRLRKNVDAPSLGTLVGMTGGPGYGSTATAPTYEALWGSALLATHDTVTVDQRGSGCSGVINCPSVQFTTRLTGENISACGALLNEKSDLYGMQQAASDINAVLDFLNITQPVDLYGESYGTFAVQAFAGNFPSRVRSIAVDGAYSVLSFDPWLPGIMNDTNAAFQNVCERDHTRCSGGLQAHLIPLLESLRAQPSSGPLISRGDIPPSPLTPTDLAFVMTTAGLNPLVYTELIAALAANQGGQSEALVRMTNAAYLYYEGGAGSDVITYSMGMLVATFCQDAPQVINMSLPVGERNLRDIIVNKTKNDSTIFFPFTIEEWVGVPLDYSYIALCEEWPVGLSSSFLPPGTPVPSKTLPDVPVLVLTGDLDSITPVCQGDQCATDYVNAQRVVVPNGLHVVALEGPECLAQVVRDFIEKGGAVNTSCTQAAYAPLRLVDVFADSIRLLPAATQLSGNAGLLELQAAAGAVYTAADAVNHFNIYAASELGLYGGYWNSSSSSLLSSSASTTTISMYGLRWTKDLALDGTVVIYDNFSVEGTVILSGAVKGTVALKWDLVKSMIANIEGSSNATIQGSINGQKITATMRSL